MLFLIVIYFFLCVFLMINSFGSLEFFVSLVKQGSQLSLIFLYFGLSKCQLKGPCHINQTKKTINYYFAFIVDELLILSYQHFLNELHQDRGIPGAGVTTVLAANCGNHMQRNGSFVDIPADGFQNTCLICKLGGMLL